MSAEFLREAARLMRDHNPPCCGHGDVCCQGVDFHHAVADWLDHEAQIADEDAADGYEMGPRYPGLIAARVYLGAS